MTSLDHDAKFFNPGSSTDDRWQYRIFLGIEHTQNRQLLAGLLGRFYGLHDSLTETLKWVNAFDLCIFDGGFFGRFSEEIRTQRSAAIPVFLPCLLLLKRTHLPLLTLSQRQQVDDVITLPVDQTELLLRVESLLRARQQSLKLRTLLAQEHLLEEQLQADNQILQRMAAQDGLTGIANRRAFDEKLAYEWKLGQREQTPLVVILCDVDYFKPYNDTYGHILGDECLRQIAGVLDRALRRPADMAARYGGEEFALVLPNTKAEGAFHLLERIRSMLKALAIPHQNSPVSPYVTLSFGLAQVLPSVDMQIEDLLKAADTALYQAKDEGRDRVIVAPPLEPHSH